MATYLRVPIETDPDTLLQAVYQYIQARIPGWQPNDGALDVWIIQAVVQEAADNRDLAADVPDTIFRSFGSSLMAIPPIDAVAASAATTWTLTNNLGHTIPAGTFVGIPNGAGDIIPFQTIQDIVVPAGLLATAAGAVSIVAVNPGAAASGLGIAGQAIQLIDVLDFVQTVTLTGPTVGGVDAEIDTDYMNRLVRRLRRLSQRPILPQDFAEAAKDADPGVFRAVAIDGYNPTANTYNNERTVTIVAVDVNGNAATAAMKTNIDAYLQANREVNFIVYEMDPNYTNIDVTTEVVALPGYDHITLATTVQAAIQDYLSPAKWGRDPSFTDVGANETWIERQTLRYNDLLAAIDRVDGVDYVYTLTLGVHGGALAAANVALAAPASLTTAGTITVTVSP